MPTQSSAPPRRDRRQGQPVDRREAEGESERCGRHGFPLGSVDSLAFQKGNLFSFFVSGLDEKGENSDETRGDTSHKPASGSRARQL